ncbi:cubilin [Folsomia candida]|uniref:Procollagen C-endopeptidase enhancer 2 n=1 Tax=Folsomia candida TaxID=158441 RepID=A0A226DZA1_FOLCA|nr:cubilin [Folsomia candida]OXA49526.1 Procollagen C-endopeptidase enhancer 2 [Folsomia candida]
MHRELGLVLVLLAVSAWGAPQKYQDNRPEDPVPVETITTCGGYIETSSGTINYQVGGSIRADMRCIWTLRAPVLNQRFVLVSSGLHETDGLYLTDFGYSGTGTGAQQRVTTVGQNYTVTSRNVLITLNVGNAPTFGFSLQFFSSGAENNQLLTGHTSLTAVSGNYSYPPGGGQYNNSETAWFTICPSVPSRPTLRFTRVDVEHNGQCGFDSVSTFTWFDNQFTEVAMFCGTTIPTSLSLQGGIGLIRFSSDATDARTGFDFEWE